MQNSIFLYLWYLIVYMQLPEIGTIIQLRKKLGLTQTQLAKKAGISQSLIARVEAGTVDPRYSKIVKLFRALEETKNNVVTAKDLMTKGVVGVGINETLSNAIKQMEKHKVSQLPVFEGNNLKGTISEGAILDQISKGVNIAKISEEKVEKYMEDPLPQINSSANLNTMSSLLEHNKAILITEKGKIEGIITKADLLKVVRS
jgi:predicted transcriptional regulator